MTDQTPIPASAPPLDQELALLRAQLQALADLALASPGDAASAVAEAEAEAEELVLLRGQLGSLAQLIQPQTALAAAPGIAPRAGEEALLLKGLLEALLPSLQTPDDAPPLPDFPAAPPPSPDLARIEAAMARLLQDLAQETSRRVQAEAEAIRARALLRRHGFQDRDAPEGVPLAPRP